MNNVDRRTEKRKTGDIGENIACDFLKKRGFEVVERNYLRKWGEIDIVARKANVIRFVEVKSVTWAIHGKTQAKVSNETYRPEDNMHPWKLKRLARTMQTYMLHKKLDCDFQLDLITVKMDMTTHKARVEMIENIVI
ncbi:MAG: YraN family protein [bacterium]|nr:YraN family protein [bacterium]